MKITSALMAALMLGGALAAPATKEGQSTNGKATHAPAPATNGAQVSRTAVPRPTSNRAAPSNGKLPGNGAITESDPSAPTAAPKDMLGTLEQVLTNIVSVSEQVQFSMTADIFIPEGACKQAAPSPKKAGLKARDSPFPASHHPSPTSRAGEIRAAPPKPKSAEEAIKEIVKIQHKLISMLAKQKIPAENAIAPKAGDNDIPTPKSIAKDPQVTQA